MDKDSIITVYFKSGEIFKFKRLANTLSCSKDGMLSFKCQGRDVIVNLSNVNFITESEEEQNG